MVFGRLAQQIAKRHFTYYGAGRSSDVRFGKKHITLQNPGAPGYGPALLTGGFAGSKVPHQNAFHLSSKQGGSNGPERKQALEIRSDLPMTAVGKPFKTALYDQEERKRAV